MFSRSARVATEAGCLIALLGVIVWISGRPFLFPSLGPTAFALALRDRPEMNTARRVIGGHLCGIVAGLFVYHALAEGLNIASFQTPLSLDGLFLSLSGALAVALTTSAMLILKATHPPACATTLIIALGLLPTYVEGAIIFVSVVVLYVVHRASLRVGDSRVDRYSSPRQQ